MNMSRLSILLAGLLAVAGAQAQTAAATSSVPIKAGEASTQVQGQPNQDPNSPSAAGTATYYWSTPAYPSTAYPSTSPPGVLTYSSAGAMGAPAATAQLYAPPHRAGVPATLPDASPSIFEGGTPQ
jgi:hypothetical protein